MQMLDGHVVLITGGGSGLGLGVARHCLDEGAEVAIFEYDSAKVASLKEEFGERVLVHGGDVRSISDLQACRDAIVERFGRLSALIGAQGIFDGMIDLMDIDLDRVEYLFEEVFSINVKGYVLSARIFGDLLIEEKGAMVLTSSSAAFAADGGGLFYTASKGAVRSLASQLAFEFSPDVRVNAIAPAGIAKSQLRGPEALGMGDSKQSDIPEEDFRDGFRRSGSLIPELPEPEDYGPLFAFLASRNNQIMTGQTVVADQGALNRALISAVGVGGVPTG